MKSHFRYRKWLFWYLFCCNSFYEPILKLSRIIVKHYLQTMQLLKLAWRRISNIGVHQVESLPEKKRIRLSNQLAALIAPVYFILGIYYGFFTSGGLSVGGAILEFSSFFLTLFAFLLSSKGYFRITLWYLFLTTLVSLILGLLLVGRSSGGEFALIVIGSSTLVFFHQFRAIIVANVFILLGFLLVHFYLMKYGSLYSITNEFNYVVTFFISIVCQLVVSFSFVQENSAFEERSIKLLNELETNKAYIEEQNRKLIKINKELESFAYATSHDLRAPLRNIVSFSDLMVRRERDNLSKDSLEYLSFIRINAKQMNQLVNDILSHSALNAEVKYEKVDLNHTIASIKSSSVIPDKSLKWELLPTINASRMEMLVLFQNLIENGLKYNRSSQPEIHIRTEQSPNKLYIYVSDNGIGIKKEYQEKVFGIFKRLHHQNEYEGTGIGLATCRKIVGRYEGRVYAESEGEGKGTTFVIELPSTLIRG